MAERRGRLSEEGVRAAIALLEGLPLTIHAPDQRSTFGAIIDLMRAHRLTAYDSVYLELAIRRRLPIGTLDKTLRAAALATGTPLLEV
jgi:predicted nucleic acid-binding protein